MKRRRKAPGYPVRTAARLSGLGIDTLRAWERRHRAVAPRRDHRGRLYTDGDVRRLRLLREAVTRGHAIGRIARLDDVQLARLGVADGALAASPEHRAVPEPDGVCAIDLAPLVDAAERFDASALDAALGRAALMLAPLDLVRAVVDPLLKRTDAGPTALPPGPQRLLRSAVRNLLGALLRLHTRPRVPGRLIFATTAGHRDEIDILSAGFLAATSGLDVIYMGPGMSSDDLLAAALHSEADVVVLGAGPDDAGTIARALSRDVELWLVGRGADRTRDSVGPRAVAIADYEALSDNMSRIGGASS